MKAWHVYDETVSEEWLLCGGEIVHAETRGKARAIFAKRWYWGWHTAFLRLKARRHPAADL